MEGSGQMLVTAVGINSQTGIIMELMGATTTKKKKKPEVPPQPVSKEKSKRQATVRDSLSRGATLKSQGFLKKLLLHFKYDLFSDGRRERAR